MGHKSAERAPRRKGKNAPQRPAISPQESGSTQIEKQKGGTKGRISGGCSRRGFLKKDSAKQQKK